VLLIERKSQALEGPKNKTKGGHENDDFDTTTASMLNIFFHSKGYGVIDLVCINFANIKLNNTLHIMGAFLLIGINIFQDRLPMNFSSSGEL